MSRAISSLRLTPILFDLGARPHPPTELYRAYLAQIWPTVRRAEADLLARAAHALDPDEYRTAFATGTQLSRHDAITLARGDRDA